MSRKASVRRMQASYVPIEMRSQSWMRGVEIPDKDRPLAQGGGDGSGFVRRVVHENEVGTGWQDLEAKILQFRDQPVTAGDNARRDVRKPVGILNRGDGPACAGRERDRN